MRSMRVLACIVACLAGGAAVGGDRVGVGVKAGTVGLGLEVTGGVTRWLALRATASRYDTSRSFDKGDITYDGTLKVGGYGLLADFYPTASKFRITAGVLGNRNAIDMTSTPTSDVTIGDAVYSPARVGTLTGGLTFRSTAPYFGIGYGNAARSRLRVGFIFDFGVEPQGAPRMTLRSSGDVPQSDLDKESAKIEDDTKSYKYWPVIALGISIRIW